jgi:hypothetical protein
MQKWQNRLLVWASNRVRFEGPSFLPFFFWTVQFSRKL